MVTIADYLAQCPGQYTALAVYGPGDLANNAAIVLQQNGIDARFAGYDPSTGYGWLIVPSEYAETITRWITAIPGVRVIAYTTGTVKGSP